LKGSLAKAKELVQLGRMSASVGTAADTGRVLVCFGALTAADTVVPTEEYYLALSGRLGGRGLSYLRHFGVSGAQEASIQFRTCEEGMLAQWFSLTRLGTRTKESNTYASSRVVNPDAQ